MPAANGDDRKSRHVMISLRTPALAAYLNVAAEEIFRSASMMTAEQLNEVFRHALRAHVAKLDNVVAAETADRAERSSRIRRTVVLTKLIYEKGSRRLVGAGIVGHLSHHQRGVVLLCLQHLHHAESACVSPRQVAGR